MQHIFMKRPSVRVTLLIIALAAAAAVVIGALVRRATGRELREAIFAELQPVALKNCALKRFGSANDGGYLMCENLIEPLDAAYSYGVGLNDDWGCEVSRRYHARCISTTALIQRDQPATAARSCFTTNA